MSVSVVGMNPTAANMKSPNDPIPDGAPDPAVIKIAYEGSTDPWSGHCVIVAGNEIVDLTIDQIDRPDRALTVPPMAFPAPNGSSRANGYGSSARMVARSGTALCKVTQRSKRLPIGQTTTRLRSFGRTSRRGSQKELDHRTDERVRLEKRSANVMRRIVSAGWPDDTLLHLKLAAKPIRRSDALWSPAASVFWNDRRELTPISIKSNL
jgi:hypothetical protein